MYGIEIFTTHRAVYNFAAPLASSLRAFLLKGVFGVKIMNKLMLRIIGPDKVVDILYWLSALNCLNI